jgi:hypothetical protein
MEWDFQKFISDMHSENQDAISKLNDTIIKGFDSVRDKINEHEKSDVIFQHDIYQRIKPIEAMAGNVKWFTRTGIAALITMLADLVLHHLGKL